METDNIFVMTIMLNEFLKELKEKDKTQSGRYFCAELSPHNLRIILNLLREREGLPQKWDD